MIREDYHRDIEIDETLAERIDELLRGERQSVHGVELWEVIEQGDAKNNEQAAHLIARLVASTGERREAIIAEMHTYIDRLHQYAFEWLQDKAFKAADDMAALERWEPKE